MATEVVPTTDPYDISTQVQEFEEAYYGEDVRDGIINLANKLNNELNDLSTHEFVSVDDTLSVQGAGADAKATGDALAAKDAAIALKADKTNALLSGKTRIAGSLSCGDNAPLGNMGIALGLGLTNNGGFGERIVLGMNNQTENDKLLIVGNGDYYGEDTKSNAMTLDYDGNAWFAGKIKVGGANYAGGSELATKAYVDDSAQPIVGTFTPAQQLSSGSEIKLRQVGNIVYVQGMYGPNASTPHERIGTGTGVAVPTGSREWLPCVTTDFQSYHAGYVALSKSGSTINFDFYGAQNDQILIINAFYIV